MTPRCRVALVILALLATHPAAHAQESGDCSGTLQPFAFTGVDADAARLAALMTPVPARVPFVRRAMERVAVDLCAGPPAFRDLVARLAVDAPPPRGLIAAPADLRLHYNSDYPRAWNDGALRSGVGISSSLSAGALLRWGRIEAAVIPELVMEENPGYAVQPFVDPDFSPLVHRWHGRFIDLPQRFGNASSTRLSAGQSYARVRHSGLLAGLSTQNIAWGPARRNPLLLGGTAPGFAHVFIESARPHDLHIGDGAFQLFWGRLDESAHFDYSDSNDHRLLAGALASFRPRGAEGLEIGIGQLHMQTWSPTTPATDLLLGAYGGLGTDSVGLPRDLRLIALFMRWAGAPAGFEIYGEWIRQDAWQQWLRLLNPFDDAQGYTLGVQRIVRRGTAAVRLSAEISHLADDIAHRDLGRGRKTFYVSPHVPQGHTHQGQLLGAPIGPGSESQFIGVDVFWKAGRTGLSAERVRYDDDAYYAVWAQVHGPHGHDTEFSVRLDQAVATRRFSVEAEVGYSIRYSRAFLGLVNNNYVDYPYREDQNVGLRLTARWLTHGAELAW